MKRSTLVLAFLLICGRGFASNYPPEFFHQRVYLKHDGPVLFAYVGNGFASRQVIGYKNSGHLAQSNPDVLDAVLISECYDNQGTKYSKSTTLELGREWHGTGYMSTPLHLQNHMAPQCLFGTYGSLGVAFSDRRGNWDSQYGRNYFYSRDLFFGRGVRPVFFDTKQSGGFYGSEINLSAWEFIIGEMKK